MILGLDMATKKTGYGLLGLDGSLGEYGVIRTTSNTSKERIKEIYDAVSYIIENNKINHIVFEDVPVWSQNNLKTRVDVWVV